MRALVVLAALAGCGRIGFDARSDASVIADADAPRDDAPAQIDAAACVAPSCTGGQATMCGARCFSACPSTLSALQAEMACEAWGGTLVTIHSQAEQDCLMTIAGSVWIGYTQNTPQTTPAAGWQWIDGSASIYTHWAGGEPSDGDGVEDGTEQCAHTYSNGDWNDRPCTSTVVTGYACSR